MRRGGVVDDSSHLWSDERDLQVVPRGQSVGTLGRAVRNQQLVEECERRARSGSPSVPFVAGLEIVNGELAITEIEEVGLRYPEVVLGDVARVVTGLERETQCLDVRRR